ncbi:MAG: leucine-rich repeat protein [Prevotellaceae bacterium]|nr:leucine-rich repeat protein [Prevotellaceae bacterium]
MTSSFNVSAEDFSVVNNGKTIYYRVTNASAREVAVTYQGATALAVKEYSGDVIIPGSVTNNSITYSVTSIDSVAFLECTGLTAITIPSTIKAIYGFAFKDCTALAVVNFNATDCTYMGSASSAVFKGATNLTTVNFGTNVRRIANNAFRDCTALNLPVFANATEVIGASAFYNCTGMTGFLNLPTLLHTIGNNAFFKCTGLSNALVLPATMKYLNNNAFLLCSGFTEALVLPNDIIFIGSAPFSGCTGLVNATETLTIPESVNSMGINAFQGFSNLKTINFNASNCQKMGVDTTTFYVFGACPLVEIINIGPNVTMIPEKGFAGLASVQYIKSESVTPPQISTNSFLDVPKNIPVSVPCNGEAYLSADNWDKFTNIQTVGNANVPYNLEATNRGTDIKLQWKGNAANCKVYRNNVLIATVSANNYIDGNVTVGSSYCYQIRVENTNPVCAEAVSNEDCIVYTSVNQVETQHFKVYPNPATDKIFIAGDRQFNSAKIYDVAGREMRCPSNYNEINISNLPQGNYIINIFYDGIATERVKFIKN